MADPAELTANGVNGRTGEPLFGPVTLDAAARAVTGRPEDAEETALVENRADDRRKEVAGHDPNVDDVSDVSQAGWGIVFNGDPARADEVAAIREQLKPLLDLRESQAGAIKADLYQEYSAKRGYRTGNSAVGWMGVNRTGPGTAFPKDMPIHLLVVGSPEEIGFEFQYGLDVQRSVGRIHFDKLEDYGRYARAVVEWEVRNATQEARLSLWGPQNPGDTATALSSKRLIAQLAEELEGHPGWKLEPLVKDAATKKQLSTLIGGPSPPALLFTASHGIGFKLGDALQESDQGALLCQDWNGDKATMGPDKYFAAADLPDSASLNGRMAFLFACYGGGTPQEDDFAHRISPTTSRQIAPKPFVAALPQKLLSNGMLAVAAHVDRAWSYSFQWGRAGTQIRSFEATLRMLMNGDPIGLAFDHMNDRAGELGFYKTALLEDAVSDPAALAANLGMWTAANDARNYIVFGDPATRLKTA